MKGKQILILVMFLLLCSFASASYDNYFIEDGISAWYLNDTEHQSFSESSTLRFSDTFTGTNGDPISTTNWDTYYTGGTSQLTEINSNAMRTTVTPPCGYTRLAVTQSDNAYSITEELVFNFSIKRNSDLDNEQVIYIQDTHLSSGTYETGKYTGIRATSAGTYELINVNASSSVNVLETISSTTTSFNDFQLRINILQQTYTLYLNGDFIGSDNIYFPANNYYITLAVSNYDCNFGRYGYFDDIYLYDNNLTLNVKDYIGTNDGTLHGKIFNHGTITGATLNNNLTGAITGATWNTSCSLPDGSIGNCLEFDGGNNKLTLDSSLTNNEDSSFCSWIYLNDIGGADSGRIFDDGKFLIWYQSSTDKLLTSNDGDSTYIRSSAISSNSWNYICVIRESTSTSTFYINGISDTSGNTGTIQSGTTNSVLGNRNSGDRGWAGSIKDVKILDKALTSDEVLDLYNSGVANYSGYAHEINFPLNEGTGTEVYTKEGKFGGYYDFDGVDDIITATGHGFTSADTFTISAWIKPSLTEISGGIVTEYDPANTGWDLDLSSGQIIMDLRGTSILSSGAVGPDLRDGVWHYVSSVVSNTTILMYVDGVLVSTTNGNWVSSVTNQPLWIGARYHPSPAGYYPFNGSIADVRIYNRSLTDSEIQTLYYGLQDINIVTDTIGSTTNNYYWNIESIYGSPYTTRNNASLDVPVGNFTFNLTNDLGFYNLTNYVLEITPTTSEYVLPIYNSVLNLTLFDVLANETKENITVDVTYSDSSTAQYLGDGTLIQIPNKKGQEMNVAWTSQDSISDGNFDYTTENMSENYTYDVYSSNSVRIYLYDIATGSLINENITLTITNLNESYINTQTINGGSFNLSGLEPDTYLITASGENFSRQVYPITVTAFSTQELNIFLTKTTEETIFTIKEASTKNVIEGATVTIKQIVNNTWTIISVLNSDITGRVIFGYNSDVHYSYIISADGYTLKTFDLNPIIFTSYNVWLEKSSAEDTTGDLKNIQVVYSPSKYFNGAINNVSLDFISPYGEFTNFGYTITSQGDTFINSSNNAYGGTLTTGLLIENASIGSIVSINYYYTKSNGVSQSYTVNFLVENTTSGINAKIGDTYGMNILERIIVYLIIMLVVAGAGAIYGGSIGASVVSLFVAGYFMHIEFLPIWLIAPSMVFMGFLTLGGKK